MLLLEASLRPRLKRKIADDTAQNEERKPHYRCRSGLAAGGWECCPDRRTFGWALVENVIKGCVGDQVAELIGMADTRVLSSLRRHTHPLSKESGHRKVPAHPGQAQRKKGRLLGAGFEQLLHHVITRSCTRVVGSAGGADDLVNLVPVHIRLLTERLRHSRERRGDRSTSRWMLTQ